MTVANDEGRKKPKSNPNGGAFPRRFDKVRDKDFRQSFG
jgi:hypothetical protein